MPAHVFFEQPVLQRNFGDPLLQVAHLLALAAGRGVGPQQRRDTLSMARGRSRRRSSGGCCHETAGSQGCASVSAAGYAALWPSGLDRHGQTWFIRCGDESYGGSKIVSFAVSGLTIEPRTRPNRSADETERWPGSGTSRPCSNSPPFTSRSTTTSTTNAISTAATFSNQPTLLRWLSGGNLQPESRSL